MLTIDLNTVEYHVYYTLGKRVISENQAKYKLTSRIMDWAVIWLLKFLAFEFMIH